MLGVGGEEMWSGETMGVGDDEWLGFGDEERLKYGE